MTHNNTHTHNHISEAQCKINAWIYYISLGYTKTSKSVLHHIDPSLKQRDPARYHQWLICDVVPMTIQEHRSLHMRLEQASRTRTREHNQHISQSLSNTQTRGKRIQVIRKSIDVRVFDTMQQAAEYIGCTKQLISQCINPNTNNRRARGYEIRLLAKGDK